MGILYAIAVEGLDLPFVPFCLFPLLPPFSFHDFLHIFSSKLEKLYVCPTEGECEALA